MDPAAPNYDRPPDRKKNRKRALARIQAGGITRPANTSATQAAGLGPRTLGSVTDAIVPPKPNNPLGAVKNSGPGSVKGAASMGLASGPGKGNLGTVDRFKAAGLKPPKGASEIGFFNATHEHGEPMKNLIAKLKRKRGAKTSASASYSPSNSMSSSR